MEDLSGGEGVGRRRGEGGEVREEREGVFDWWVETRQRGGVLSKERNEGSGIERFAGGWFLQNISVGRDWIIRAFSWDT